MNRLGLECLPRIPIPGWTDRTMAKIILPGTRLMLKELCSRRPLQTLLGLHFYGCNYGILPCVLDTQEGTGSSPVLPTSQAFISKRSVKDHSCVTHLGKCWPTLVTILLSNHPRLQVAVRHLGCRRAAKNGGRFCGTPRDWITASTALMRTLRGQ